MSINENIDGSPITASTSTELVDHNHPLYIHPSDTQGICRKNRYDTSLHELWDRCNAIVLAWIMNTISPSLISSVIYASDAYTVWEDLKKRFDRDNASRACYLHKEIAILTQGISYVSVHYTKLRELWDEYETLTPPPTCGCAESRKYVEHYQIQKLYQFLTGLNESYENAKNHVLMTRPLPNLNQAYAMIVNVKSQRIDEKCVFFEGNEAAMMSNKGYSGGQTNNNPNGWFIGGYNSGGQNKWKGGKPNAQANSVTSYGVSTSDIQGQGHQTPVTSPAHFFTQEQYQQIQHLLNKDKEAEPVASAVTAGTTEKYDEIPENARNKVHLSAGEQVSITHTYICSFFKNKKELSSGKVLGIGKEELGLYILKLKEHHCTVCPVAKQSRLPFPTSSSCSKYIFDIVHGDVWRPYKVATHDEKRYFLTLVNEYSRFSWLFLLHSKSDTVELLLKTQGIVHQSSCTYIPKQNEVVERKHRSILDMARALRDTVFKEEVFPFKHIASDASSLFPVLELVEQSTQPAVDLNDVEYPAASPSQFPTTTPGQHSIDAVESPSSSLSSISIPSNLG
ncbi:uncharacterized protein LOC142176810 [Nicotiana tabacum]|uniref:Uncharacterized protein LOC142176810 n=1 Tax=Nicotiana tabacum TaxID=4097 RepID=A0AC58TVN1_TOBAC